MTRNKQLRPYYLDDDLFVVWREEDNMTRAEIDAYKAMCIMQRVEDKK